MTNTFIKFLNFKLRPFKLVDIEECIKFGLYKNEAYFLDTFKKW